MGASLARPLSQSCVLLTTGDGSQGGEGGGGNDKRPDDLRVGARVRMSTPTWPTPDSSSVRVRSALTFHVVMSEQGQRAQLGKDTEELKEGKATTM